MPPEAGVTRATIPGHTWEYVSQCPPQTSCVELKEQARELLLHTWLKEGHYYSTPICGSSLQARISLSHAHRKALLHSSAQISLLFSQEGIRQGLDL